MLKLEKYKVSVCVVGLGRVGLITLFHLAGKGFKVYGYDINGELIDRLKNNKQPFTEPGFSSLLKKHYKKIQFSSKIPATPYYFICVPTPFNNKTYKMSLDYVQSALKQIKKTKSQKWIFIRSTLTPGSSKKLSNKFKHLSISYFPEFFREGCFVKDYRDTVCSVLGFSNTNVLKSFSQFQFSKNVESCSLEEAEILKMSCNLFHGLKISFANEIGRIANYFKADPHRIMDIFLKDKKLNISKKYLKPGFSYGGPCLSKDIQSLNALQSSKQPQWLLPHSIENSNRFHTQWVLKKILNLKPKTIGILGCSFTGNPACDYRQSPVLQLVEMLSKYNTIKLYGVEEPLTHYKCLIISKKSLEQLVNLDMCILGGWNSFCFAPSLFSNYKGILFDLLIQNMPKYIKNHPNYKTAFS